MNIWVEYWKYDKKSKNTHAQIRELSKWEEPDPKKITTRFFSSKKEAMEFATRMGESGHRTRIKEDVGH